MADPLTWPAAFMGAFTIINASVLVPVVRSWTKNRHLGRQKDAKAEENTARLEAAIRELTSTVTVVGQAVGDVRTDVKVLKDRSAIHDREIERLRDRVERHSNGRRE